MGGRLLNAVPIRLNAVPILLNAVPIRRRHSLPA
jgi:hypothetical protein